MSEQEKLTTTAGARPDQRRLIAPDPIRNGNSATAGTSDAASKTMSVKPTVDTNATKLEDQLVVLSEQLVDVRQSLDEAKAKLEASLAKLAAASVDHKDGVVEEPGASAPPTHP